MRLTIASLRRVVKGDLTIQFVPQALTSYGGLELLGRYLRKIDLGARLRQAFAGLRSDYGSARIALVLLALFYVGARRLEHRSDWPGARWELAHTLGSTRPGPASPGRRPPGGPGERGLHSGTLTAAAVTAPAG
jgi:hypothetical protein